MEQEMIDPYGLDLLGDLFTHPTETEEPIINDGGLFEAYPISPIQSAPHTAA
jgi:hypothetical protein